MVIRYELNEPVNIYKTLSDIHRAGIIDGTDDEALVKAKVVDSAVGKCKVYNFFRW